MQRSNRKEDIVKSFGPKMAIKDRVGIEVETQPTNTPNGERGRE